MPKCHLKYKFNYHKNTTLVSFHHPPNTQAQTLSMEGECIH